MSEHLSGLIIKDVFISYGRKESTDFAKKLQKRFKKESMYAWFDANDIPAAVDWQQRIYKGIDEAHNFVFVISPYSLQSKYCFKEIKYAVKQNKRIIPIMHLPVSDADIRTTHPIISEINWIPFGDEEASFEKSFDVLLQAIQKEAKYVSLHTDILLKAKYWEQNGSPNSLLLHSHEREIAEQWLAEKFKPEEGVCNASDIHAYYICESKKNSQNQMTDVLLVSMQHEGVRDQLLRSFHREGITTWKYGNDSNVGVNKRDGIKIGIQRTAALVFFISPVEMQSEYLRYHLELALEYNKPIIPVIIEDTPSNLIPTELRNIPSFDLSRFTGESYVREVQRLIKLLREHEVYGHLHRNFLVQAIKWKEQGENKSTLLQGARLQEAEDWLTQAMKRESYQATPLHTEFIQASLDEGYEINSELFICYSRVDSDFVRKLNDELQIMGRVTWFDMESIAPGRDFYTEIRNGIESSDSILFVISPDSVVSENCKMEIEYAESFNKRFINVLFRNPNGEALPAPVANIQWIDFTKHYRDFHKPLSELMRTIDNQREHVREHTIWLKAAKKWEMNGKPVARLLTGADYVDAQDWLQETIKNPSIQQPTDLIREFIEASHSDIKEAEEKEIRQKKFLISALVVMSVLFVISILLGAVAFKQRLDLASNQNLLRQTNSELQNINNMLKQTLDENEEAQRVIEETNKELAKLRVERDSAANAASTVNERNAILQKYTEEIIEKKENSELEKARAEKRLLKAAMEAEQMRRKQIQQEKEQRKQAEQSVIIDTRNYYNGLAKDLKNERWGYINNKAEIIIQHQFVQASDFEDGVAQVYKDEMYAYINTKGQTISGWFDRIEPFVDGLAEVKRDRMSNFIDEKGKLISKTWYKSVYDFHEGRAKVKVNNKWGYIDRNGEMVVQPIYDAAFAFKGGKAKVRIGESTFYINENGGRVFTARSWVTSPTE